LTHTQWFFVFNIELAINPPLEHCSPLDSFLQSHSKLKTQLTIKKPPLKPIMSPHFKPHFSNVRRRGLFRHVLNYLRDERLPLGLSRADRTLLLQEAVFASREMDGDGTCWFMKNDG
jgi:hypothetical protein